MHTALLLSPPPHFERHFTILHTRPSYRQFSTTSREEETSWVSWHGQILSSLYTPLCSTAQSTKQISDLTKIHLVSWVSRNFWFLHVCTSKATLLVHPQHDALASITSDASGQAVGAVLEQFIDHEWRPIAFFSRKLRPAETRYSVFDRELLGVYLAIRHFRWFVEGRVFHVYTDHKPLTFAISQSSTQRSPRQIRQLAFISEFTTDLRHVKGKHNAVADAFSRVQINATSYTEIDFRAMAHAQVSDLETQCLKTGTTNLKLVNIPLEGPESPTLLCDLYRGSPQSSVLEPFRREVFNVIHNLSYLGVRATCKLIRERFVWNGLSRCSPVNTNLSLLSTDPKAHHRPPAVISSSRSPFWSYSRWHWRPTSTI